MRHLAIVASVCWPALLACAATPTKTSGPYRGPMNNGIFADAGLMQSWPAEGPKLLWKAKLGEGYASTVVADGAVYTLGGASGVLYGFTLDGQPKFKHPYGRCSWARFNGSRSTPLVRDGLAVVVAPDANVYAIDLATGTRKWKVNAWKDFGSGKGNMGWGFNATPAICEGKVILNTVSRDDQTPPIVAVDFATGKTVWQADAGQGKKYSANSMSSVVFTHNGRALNVNPTWRYLLCLDPADGKRLWEIPELDVDKGSSKSITPVYGEGHLLFGRAGTVVCVKLSQDGTSYTPLWARPHTGFGNAVILDKRVYIEGSVADNVWKGAETLTIPAVPKLAAPRLPKGAAAPPPLPRGLLCLDAETGELLDFIRMPDGLGQVISSDGMIYAQGVQRGPEAVRAKWEEGVSKLGIDVCLLKPVESGMDLTGHFWLPMTRDDANQVRELEYQANVTPVVSEGRLFIRYGPLWVYDLRAPKDPLSRPFEPPLPGAGLWDLRLKGFFDAARDLLVTLQVKDGAVVSAVAGAPAWNRATHTVDAKGVKVAGGELAGSLTVTLNPDASIPADKSPITRTVEVKVRVVRDRLKGTYLGGMADGRTVDGRVSGP